MQPIARASFFAIVVLCGVAGRLAATQQAAQLLPPETKGYVSIEHMDQFLEAWNKTQLSGLLHDRQLQVFVEDVAARIRQNFSQTYTQLAVDWQVIRQLAAGQVAAAVLEPDGENSHAVVVLIDVGDGRNVPQVQAQIDQHWKLHRATVAKQHLQQTDVTVYAIPVVDAHRSARHAYYAVAGGKWIATDNQQVLQGILDRIQNPGRPSLADRPAYRATQHDTALQNGTINPHVRWYVEPFGYARIVRATTRRERQRGTDMLRILQQQGFDVIEAVGGQLAFSVGDFQLLHRTLVYAPGERRLAARMLNFPNGPALQPADWIPGDVANYLAMRWDMPGAFESIKTLVDALTGDGFFDEFLANLEQDPKGPQVNLRDGLVRHLGQHIVFLSDCTHPITPESERFAVAIEITNTQAVAATVERMLRQDRAATRHELAGHVVWEIKGDETEQEITLTVEVDTAPGFGFGAKRQETVQEEVPSLPSTAVAVADGWLWFSSHREYLTELLQRKSGPSLAEQADYRRVDDALNQLGAGTECLRLFSRSDETYHATYELIRQGRMPESESLLGKWLNYAKSNPLQPRRSQELNGSTLPPFEHIRRYFGPAGLYSCQHERGWTITGCLLEKKADEP